MYSFSSHRSSHLLRRKDIAPIVHTRAHRLFFAHVLRCTAPLFSIQQDGNTNSRPFDAILPFCPPGHTQTDLGSLLFGNIALSALCSSKRVRDSSTSTTVAFAKELEQETQLPGNDSPRPFSLCLRLMFVVAQSRQTHTPSQTLTLALQPPRPKSQNTPSIAVVPSNQGGYMYPSNRAGCLVICSIGP